jgi:DNA-directed RNA polymerase subunit RPC12/RpoP
MNEAPPQVGTTEGQKRFPCEQCGARLAYAPGTTVLRCAHCGHENTIPQSEEEIEELDYHEYVGRLCEGAECEERHVVKCDACAAEFQPPPNVTASTCPFCGSHIVATEKTERLLKPKSLLPFRVTGREAETAFRDWLRKRWFAPNKLRQYARQEQKLNGMYCPYWTYDADTKSFYRGERGDDYYVTVGTGKNRRTERRTRWTSVSGTVWNTFDDVLIVASHSLPKRYAIALEPWDLQNLAPYSDEYLSGFAAESYQVDLEQGFALARGIMDERIRASIRADIGGDHQRIHSVKTQYDNVTFKHVLLPVWLSAYRFREKIYRFLVNARTGEVQGERPYSWIKITLFVLLLAAIAGGIWWAVAANR